MEVISLFESLNKLSLLAFIAVLGVLGFEIYSFKKANKKNINPSVPSFTGTSKLPINNPTLLREGQEHIEKKSMKIFILLGALLIMFGVLTILSFNHVSSTGETNSVTNIPSVTYSASNGIKFFSVDFKPVADDEVKKMKDTDVKIGIETVRDADIDRARIRVNSKQWKLSDVTAEFNKEFNVYYIQYHVASSPAELMIEAQLHSKEDGWLGE